MRGRCACPACPALRTVRAWLPRCWPPTTHQPPAPHLPSPPCSLQFAAEKYGAGEVVDPRPFLVGSLLQTAQRNPHLGRLIPAMGYYKEQVGGGAGGRCVGAGGLCVYAPEDSWHVGLAGWRLQAAGRLRGSMLTCLPRAGAFPAARQHGLLPVCLPSTSPPNLPRHVQIADLEASINAVPCDVVIIATPMDLRKVITLNKPATAVSGSAWRARTSAWRWWQACAWSGRRGVASCCPE